MAEDADVGLHLRNNPDLDRASIDPTVLVALIGTGGAALTALIQGILQILTPKQTLVLRGKSGRSLEVPASTSKEKLLELVDTVKELDVEEIIV